MVLNQALQPLARNLVNSIVMCAIVALMNYKDFITVDSNKMAGKPCVRGLRITVYDVLDYLASGMKPEEIISDFPDLKLEDIQACLAFAADRERKLAKHSA